MPRGGPPRRSGVGRQSPRVTCAPEESSPPAVSMAGDKIRLIFSFDALLANMTGPRMDTDLHQLVTAAVTSLRPGLLALSRDLFDHPELTLQETRSTALLQEMLKAEGF